VLFLENRDRKYDADVYTLRGAYNIQDTDFNLSQFGLFLQNDTVFLTVHINNSVDTIGRKIMSGDVVELPNLKDEYALNDFKSALKRYYVVEDINRAAEGYSVTWYPHLYRLKLKPIIDSQEYRDILEKPAGEDGDRFAGDYDSTQNYYPGQIVRQSGILYEVLQEIIGNTDMAPDTSIAPPSQEFYSVSTTDTLRDLMSTYKNEMLINAGVVAEAESDAELSGSDTTHFYTLSVDGQGRSAVETVDTDINVASAFNVSNTSNPPIRDGYKGYLLEDGVPPNTSAGQFGFGIQFPRGPVTGDTFLRTDYLPNRLFKWDGRRWVRQEDNVRMTLGKAKRDPVTNKVVGLDEFDFDVRRQTLKTSFINNSNLSGITKLGSDTFNALPFTILDFNLSEEYDENDTVVYNDDVYIVRIKPLVGTLPTNSTYFTKTSSKTRSFTNNNVVTTLYNYDSKYVVEVWLDEQSRVTSINTQNDQGKLAFIINNEIQDGSKLRWSIYDTVVEERQSLTKALRKIKPQADN
jgi:hypothetical protein